jgi:hypothetical protein
MEVDSLPKDTSEIETGMAEKSSLGTRKKLGLVWRNRKKSSQIINAYLYLPFFLLIILCSNPLRFSPNVTHCFRDYSC